MIPLSKSKSDQDEFDFEHRVAVSSLYDKTHVRNFDLISDLRNRYLSSLKNEETTNFKQEEDIRFHFWQIKA